MAKAGLAPPPAAGRADAAAAAPPRVEKLPDGSESLEVGSVRVDGIRPPPRPELVPAALYFDSPQHTAALEAMLRDYELGQQLLLIGNQGVGKNKLTDRMLQLLRREREYMQLHRDTSVASLTQTPSLVDGELIWEDSPLVRALTHGRVLVLDEADKAPLEVVCVLRSLIEEGRMLLADGRRVVPAGSPPRPRTLPLADGFRVIVLANRPGYPFLGNDFFREMGDILATHVVDNPALPSEVALLAAYGPDVPPPLLRRIAAIFGELRSMADAGEIAYPYSTREAVALVKHLQSFPSDGLLAAAENVFAFDGHEPAIAQTITSVLRRHGVPAGGGAGAFDVRLAAEEDLPPSEPLELWSAGGNGGAEVPLQAVEVGGARWAGGRQASWRLERSPDEPSLGWQDASVSSARSSAAGGCRRAQTRLDHCRRRRGGRLASPDHRGCRWSSAAVVFGGWCALPPLRPRPRVGGADTLHGAALHALPDEASSSTCHWPRSSSCSALRVTPKPRTPRSRRRRRRRRGGGGRGGGRLPRDCVDAAGDGARFARGGARRARQGRRRSRRRVAVGRLHRRAARRRRCGARRRWRVGVRRWWCRFAAVATE